MAKRCNRLKRDGTRYRRGPGCRIQHKGPDVRAAEIAVATTDGDLTLDDYATETAGDVIGPFNQSGMLIEPDGVEQISVDQIMNVLADPALDGRMISPRTSGTDVVIEASQGVAVTLPGSGRSHQTQGLNHLESTLGHLPWIHRRGEACGVGASTRKAS